MRASLVVAAFVLTGFAPARLAAQAAPDTLAASDWRRSLVGHWRVQFWLDWYRTKGETEVRPMLRGGGDSATGTLIITDSLFVGFPVLGVRASLSVDFVPLLGRPMSCFASRPPAISIHRDNDSTMLDLTPHARDCGVTAAVRLQGDSATGTWMEGAFAGTPAAGRFKMQRIR